MTPAFGGLLRKGIDVDAPLADARGGFQGFDQPRALDAGEADPVLDHFEGIAAPRMYTGVALALEELLNLAFREVLRHRDGKRDDDPRIAGGAGALRQVGGDAVRR